MSDNQDTSTTGDTATTGITATTGDSPTIDQNLAEEVLQLQRRAAVFEHRITKLESALIRTSRDWRRFAESPD